MKASEMMDVVQDVERSLHQEVADVIAKHINMVSSQTGLTVTAIDIGLIESTHIGSDSREWAVTYCNIDTELPPKIFKG